MKRKAKRKRRQIVDLDLLAESTIKQVWAALSSIEEGINQLEEFKEQLEQKIYELERGKRK